MKILICDDEELIRNVIKEYCALEKYEAVEAENGKEAILKMDKDIDLIIMDIMMPEMDGFSAYKKIRESYNTPAIMLSARGEEYDKLLGFELGIDDYVTKPFSPKELIARIKAITKRNKQNEDKFIYQNLAIDYLGHVVYINDQKLPLTPKEYELLVYFVKNKNIALTREQLLSNVWGYDFFGDDRTIDTHVKMLRNNLKEYRDLITTVRSVGYKFEIEEK